MTEKTLTDTIRKIAGNYNQLEQSLVDQLLLETPNHYPTIGTHREQVWKSLFEMIIPKKYCIEQGVFIIDSYGQISNEVDLAVFDETYTPYIFNYGEIKFIPIEAVAAVVQCKSKIDKCRLPGEIESEGKKKDDNEEDMDENKKKKKETIYENLLNWVKSINALKTSLNSVSRTMSDLVDNDDRKLRYNEYAKLTQTSTRPITVLCATQISKSMVGELQNMFDMLLYVEEKGTKKDEKSLIKIIHWEKQDFVKWNEELNHSGHERYEENEKGYMADRMQDKMKSKEALLNRNLSQLSVIDKDQKENTILSLTFQFNQLLMLINNPMLFPHRAYAERFSEILGGKLPEGGDQDDE